MVTGTSPGKKGKYGWCRRFEDLVGFEAFSAVDAADLEEKTLYFDGFACSGLITSDGSEETIKGTALRILDIILPRPFDTYYFVELDENYKRSLEAHINTKYFGRNAHVVKGDCNTKLVDMAKYLKRYTNFRSLAFVDPYGMSVNWSSIEALKGLGIDLLILVHSCALYKDAFLFPLTWRTCLRTRGIRCPGFREIQGN